MTDTTKEEEEMLRWAKEYARKNGLILNADEKQLGTVIRWLVRNRTRFGKAYCPCRLRSGDEEKDAGIVCPCIFHEDEIAKDGHCHCNLFYKKD